MKSMILACILALFSISSAEAHARLVSASPPVGGTVADVAEIRLLFNEGVEGAFSSITLSSAAGDKLSVPAAATDPKDRRVLRIVLAKPLAPGEYALSWSVVSVDTHRTSGSFTFTVRP